MWLVSGVMSLFAYAAQSVVHTPDACSGKPSVCARLHACTCVCARLVSYLPRHARTTLRRLLMRMQSSVGENCFAHARARLTPASPARVKTNMQGSSGRRSSDAVDARISPCRHTAHRHFFAGHARISTNLINVRNQIQELEETMQGIPKLFRSNAAARHRHSPRTPKHTTPIRPQRSRKSAAHCISPSHTRVLHLQRPHQTSVPLCRVWGQSAPAPAPVAYPTSSCSGVSASSLLLPAEDPRTRGQIKPSAAAAHAAAAAPAPAVWSRPAAWSRVC